MAGAVMALGKTPRRHGSSTRQPAAVKVAAR